MLKIERREETFTKQSKNQRDETQRDGWMVQMMVYIESIRKRNKFSSYASSGTKSEELGSNSCRKYKIVNKTKSDTP